MAGSFMRPLIIAPMVETDLDRVLEIERLSFPKPWTTTSFHEEIRLDFASQVVARVRTNGPVLGYGCWWVVAGEVQIMNVAIHPSSRGEGVATGIVGHILAAGAAGGASIVGLEVDAENQAAIALYEGCGFSRVGERRDYYGAGKHAVLMDCRLPGGEPGSDSVRATQDKRRS